METSQVSTATSVTGCSLKCTANGQGGDEKEGTARIFSTDIVHYSDSREAGDEKIAETLKLFFLNHKTII